MCFTIDRTATPWPETTVYKVVTRGTRESPQQFPKCKVYTRGAVRIARGETSYRGQTKAGIYVCLTLEVAERYLRNNFYVLRDYMIIKLRVNPKDFLFAAQNDGAYSGCATYRRVKVIS